MSATLPLAREAFIKGMNQNVGHLERPRLLAVLDAMIAWSAARPGLVRFRADDNEKGVVRFEQISSSTVIWAASPRRQNAPVLELLPGAGRYLTEEEKASALSTLSAHTRETLDTGRLHISFGALKNAAARAAVLELMSELLAKTEAARRATAKTPAKTG